VLFLDQVTDPHNVGAILRSAAAFGAAAVITTRRHAPPVTGVLAKSASGALEHVPYLQETNLADAMTAARDAGYLILGFDEGGEELESVAKERPVALVFGAEGAGLRERTRETCDALVRLRTGGAIGSLNVSNAAAVALYAVTNLRGR
jgi:23S rRNA (guanosine2251-2'-O)-methyltransferase